MSTGNVNLRLASALMAEMHREAERNRRLLEPAGSASARATPERRRLSLHGLLVSRQPRRV